MSRATPEHYARALLQLASDRDADAVARAVDAVADELAAAGRSGWLTRVLAAVERSALAAEGGMRVTVEAPEPLTAADRTALAERLGVSPDKLVIDERVDATLAAGMRVTAGDVVVAGTARDRARRLFVP